MFRIASVICVFLFSFLHAGEISLHSFEGSPGDYIAIQNFQEGTLEDNRLDALNISIDITKLNRSEGTLSIKVADKDKKIEAINLVAMPENPLSHVTFIKSTSNEGFFGGKTTSFEANGDLGPDSFLKIEIKKEENSASFGNYFSMKHTLGPKISLLVKGEESPEVTRYRVDVKEARDNTGLNLKRSSMWTHINSQFMWIGESLFGKPHPKDEIKTDFFLEVPSRDSTKIERITGDLIMSFDKTHELSLDLSLGKLVHPELSQNGLDIEVTKFENNHLELTYSNADNKLFSIAMDPRDQNFGNVSQLTRMEEEKTIFTCTTDLHFSSNTGLLLTLIDSSREIRVPFELNDLSLLDPKTTAIGTF